MAALKNVGQLSHRDLEREALEYVLSNLLNDEASKSIINYFEFRHAMSLEGKASLSTKEIKQVLDIFFGTGSALILGEFHKKLSELRTT